MAKKKTSAKRPEPVLSAKADLRKKEIQFFGLLMSVMGLFWLAKDLNWFAMPVLMGPLMLLIVGLLIVIGEEVARV